MFLFSDLITRAHKERYAFYSALDSLGYNMLLAFSSYKYKSASLFVFE